MMKLNMNYENKEQFLVWQHMIEYASIRATIPNANNGRAYMACVILDDRYCPLCGWL